MIGNWSSWKRFPNAARGEHVEAPIGPGVYEVRKVSTGNLAAFDASANVAHALSALMRRSPSLFDRLFGRGRESLAGHDLEYRTCAAASIGDARIMAQALLGRRQVYMRKSSPQTNFAGSI